MKLEEEDKTRDTFYTEILDIIAAYEFGLADALQSEAHRLNRKLISLEVDGLFEQFSSQAHWKPLLEKARSRMASRDLAFRDALHERLKLSYAS